MSRPRNPFTERRPSAPLSTEEFGRRSEEACSRMRADAPSPARTPEARPSPQDGAFLELISLQQALQRGRPRQDGALEAAVADARALQQAISAETWDAQLLQLSGRVGLLERGIRDGLGAVRERNRALGEENRRLLGQARRLCEQNDRLAGIIRGRGRARSE